MIRYIYILLAVTLLVSCATEEQTPTYPVGQGSISFGTAITSTVQDSAQDSAQDEGEYTPSPYAIPEALIPTADDLKLHITGQYIGNLSGVMEDYDEEFENLSAYSTSQDGSLPELWSGDYVATLSYSYDGDESVESKTNACFSSEEYPFTIEVDNFEKKAAIAVGLQNSMVRVVCDEWFDGYFSSSEFTVTTGSGNEFTFDPTSGEESIIFTNASTTLKLKGVATTSSSGTEITFSEAVVGETIGGWMNTIFIELSQIGGLSITVDLNENIIDIYEDIIELNPLD